MWPADAYVVDFQYSAAGEYCSTKVLFKKLTDSSNTIPTYDLALAFTEFWVPEIAQCMSEHVAFLSVYARTMLPDFFPPGRVDQNAVGARPGDMLPASQGVCITQYTIANPAFPRLLRRSNVWSGVPELDQSEGSLNSGAFNRWSVLREMYEQNLQSPAAGNAKWAPCCGSFTEGRVTSIAVASVRREILSKRSRISRRRVLP